MIAIHREGVQRVLYVDDDPVSRRIFEQLGKTAQIPVDVCGSLDEAFAYARQQPYSVIAADYSLRRWDGLSVLRELSALQRSASLMLVTDAERRHALPSSLLNYVFVEKPIRRAKVLSQLSEALSAYEDRARTPHAALLSAPILLLSESATTAGYLARCIAEQGQGRLRVTRAHQLSQAVSMLGAVSFAAALIDPTGQTESVRAIVEALRAHAPELPILLVSEELERGSLAGVTRLNHVKPQVHPELLMHLLFSAVERAVLQREIETLVHDDLTTGACNRPTFCAALNERLQGGEPFAVTCFAVEGLREINEALGHLRGDAVLAASIVRVRRELGEHATIGRLGGSVFAVLLPSLADEGKARAEGAIRQCFEPPFDLSDTQVRVTAEVASCAYPQDGARAEELLRCVERSLHKHKER